MAFGARRHPTAKVKLRQRYINAHVHMRTQSHKQDAEHGCHRFLSLKSFCANAEHVQGTTRGWVWFLSDSYISFKDAPTVSHDLQGRAAEAGRFVAHGAQRTRDKAREVLFGLAKYIGLHMKSI